MFCSGDKARRFPHFRRPELRGPPFISRYFHGDRGATSNAYEASTCQGNWYEERFFHANTRGDEPVSRTRPLEDEIEHIPRVKRLTKPTGETFRPENDETPDEHFMSMYQATYVRHLPSLDSITTRRMNTTPDRLQGMLAAQPTRYVCDHSLPFRSPEKQYRTVCQKSYVRHI
jgi:hypothetical protein